MTVNSVWVYLCMTLVAMTLGSQVSNKYKSYGNTMWGGDIANCVSTSVLSSETNRGESRVVKCAAIEKVKMPAMPCAPKKGILNCEFCYQRV